eukprot:Sspe_Gene.63011::Locus_35753_Transcript_1_1_Confidence_1.000_Length_1309::g.63011::m.63011
MENITSSVELERALSQLDGDLSDSGGAESDFLMEIEEAEGHPTRRRPPELSKRRVLIVVTVCLLVSISALACIFTVGRSSSPPPPPAPPKITPHPSSASTMPVNYLLLMTENLGRAQRCSEAGLEDPDTAEKCAEAGKATGRAEQGQKVDLRITPSGEWEEESASVNTPNGCYWDTVSTLVVFVNESSHTAATLPDLEPLCYSKAGAPVASPKCSGAHGEAALSRFNTTSGEIVMVLLCYLPLGGQVVVTAGGYKMVYTVAAKEGVESSTVLRCDPRNPTPNWTVTNSSGNATQKVTLSAQGKPVFSLAWGSGGTADIVLPAIAPPVIVYDGPRAGTRTALQSSMAHAERWSTDERRAQRILDKFQVLTFAS